MATHRPAATPVNDLPADALPFVQKAGITYPVGVDHTFRVTSGLYGLDGLPQTFFLNAKHRVVDHIFGAVTLQDLNHGIALATASS